MSVESVSKILSRIYGCSVAAPNDIALIVDGESWSYSRLIYAAENIARRLQATGSQIEQEVVAVVADRHASSYIAILGALLSGKAFVPLNPDHPQDRNIRILQLSGAKHIVHGTQSTSAVQEILQADDLVGVKPNIITCGDRPNDFSGDWRAGFHKLSPVLCENSLAYILFTSGSTGIPKGVPIRLDNLRSYLDAAGDILNPGQGDRFSQTFDLNFDLSMHDIFMSWTHGATLVVPSKLEMKTPAQYIKQHKITHWFSVPSLAYQIRAHGALEENAFPDLKSSLFCGEVMPTYLAHEWMKAAPNSKVQNWYGPTEATIACSYYVVDGKESLTDNLPIGKAFEGMRLLVLAEGGKPSDIGETGELYLSGRQLAFGYLKNVEATAQSFVNFPYENIQVYKTGDRAVLGEDGEIRFLGRTDNQVKIRGYRIELGEVESALRICAAGRNAVALTWPPGANNPSSIMAVIEGTPLDVDEIQRELETALPAYMVPANTQFIPEFCKNSSGKIDRKAISKWIEENRDNYPPLEVAGLSENENKLLEMIRRAAPALDISRVLKANTLFFAGMDSLSFVNLTMYIEDGFDLELEPERVVALSEMSFNGICTDIFGEAYGAEKITPLRQLILQFLKKVLKPKSRTPAQRANRAYQFIERFPELVKVADKPLVICIGSSGTLHAFDPLTFEHTASTLGQDIYAVNAGLPAVNTTGLAKVASFVRDTLKEANKTAALIIYELDPMQISVLPPKGEIGLDDVNLKARSGRKSDDLIDAKLQWKVENRGNWDVSLDAKRKELRPKWMKSRDVEIAHTFMGQIGFDESSWVEWQRGANALKDVSERLVCFVQPLEKSLLQEIGSDNPSERLNEILASISNDLKVEVLPWQDFDLELADFGNFNHMNTHQGRQKLSRQLAQMIFS